MDQMGNRHASGPWECFLQLRNRRTGAMDAVICSSSGEVLATVRDVATEGNGRLASARLMAAAPDLLDVVREVARYGNVFPYRRGEESLYERAKRVIAIAEGNLP
jgi:hypothetical protein